MAGIRFQKVSKHIIIVLKYFGFNFGQSLNIPGRKVFAKCAIYGWIMLWML